MKIKYIVGLVLFAFVAVTTFVVFRNISSQKKLKKEQIIETATISKNNAVLLTVSEIAKHNSQKNCWMIINNKVYNLTDFFGSHPGGDQALAFNCGSDATIAFDTKGGKGSHPQSALATLAEFYIGNIGELTQ